MEKVLQGLQWKSLLLYLDDVIVFSTDFSSHIDRLRTVLTRFRHAKLKLKPSKMRAVTATGKIPRPCGKQGGSQHGPGKGGSCAKMEGTPMSERATDLPRIHWILQAVLSRLCHSGIVWTN